MQNLDHIPVLQEIETAAYNRNDQLCVQLAARLIELQTEFDALQDKFDAMKPYPADYEEYKQFFFESVYQLKGTWPMPMINDEHLKTIIFEAIEKGDVI